MCVCVCVCVVEVDVREDSRFFKGFHSPESKKSVLIPFPFKMGKQTSSTVQIKKTCINDLVSTKKQ